MSAEPLPEIIAHRGNASGSPRTRSRPSNPPSRSACVTSPDVQLTADRVPVLLHDVDLVCVADRPDHVSDIPWRSR
jgi:glycerophosphoryl diester phosphodiesterase